jgi:hypothetical protein
MNDCPIEEYEWFALKISLATSRCPKWLPCDKYTKEFLLSASGNLGNNEESRFPGVEYPEEWFTN